ncbi:MAG: hypothetical protein ACTSQP_18840 [Promethearchaeota archaeon]
MKYNKKIVYFKKLYLENWAQFQNITFEFPEVKPENTQSKIIYFLAENGVGKTRLFQAFRAVLFGDNDSSLSKFRESNLYELYPSQKKENIIQRLKNKEFIEPQIISLTLEFVVIDFFKKSKLKKFYKIERTWTYKNFSLNENNVNFEVEKNIKVMERTEGGLFTNLIDKEKFNRLITELWPDEARDFYFFDGEKLQKMMEDPDKKEIKDKALKNSDYYPLEIDIIPNIETIMLDFEKSKTKKSRKEKLVSDADLHIEKISKEISKEKKKLDQNSKKIEKLKNELKSLEDQFSLKFNSKIYELKKFEKIRPDIERYNKLKEQRDKIYDEISNMMGDHKKKIYYFEWLLIYDILIEVMEDLKEKKRKNVIPTKIDKATIEYIKGLEYCICGNPIGDKELKCLQEHQEKAVDEKLNELANKYLNFLMEYSEKLIEIKEILDQKCKDFSKISNELEELRQKIPSYSSDIDAQLFEDFIEIQNKIHNLRIQIEKINTQNIDLEKKIKEKEKEKSDWENKRLRRLRAKKRIEKSELYHLVTRECYFLLKKIKENLKNEIISTIKLTTNNTFMNLIPEPEKYLGVYIDENWRFGFIHKDNPNTPIFDPSKGQFHVIGLSFLKSVSKVAKHKIPILFDTPFGRLSTKPKINIGKSLPQLFEGTQVIIFLTGEEARNMIDYISDKEGYELFNRSGYEVSYEKIKNSSDLMARMERIKESII